MGWIVAIIIFFLFGKQISAVVSSASNVFTNGQAIPGSPTGLPFAPVVGAPTTQDQVNGNPVPTPAPWVTQCGATLSVPPSTPLPTIAGVLNYPTANVPRRIVTFQA